MLIGDVRFEVPQWTFKLRSWPQLHPKLGVQALPVGHGNILVGHAQDVHTLADYTL